MKIADRTDSPQIDRIMADPSVVEGAALGDTGLNAERLFDLGCTILLDDHGCFVLKPLNQTQVDVHTMFEKGHRGVYASTCVKDGLLWVFTATDVMQVFTKVAHSQKGVKFFTCAMGFSRYDEDEQFTYYKLDLLDWIKQSPELHKEGHELQSVFRPDREPDHKMPFLDKMLGFASKCIKNGLLFRGVGIYNPIAETHLWPLLLVKSVNPIRIEYDDLTIDWADNQPVVAEDTCQR